MGMKQNIFFVIRVAQTRRGDAGKERRTAMAAIFF
jgi:hypothetical protein